MSAVVTYKSMCTETASFTNNLNAQLSAKISELTTQITQALDLNPSSQTSKNILNIFNTMQISIMNQYTSICTSNNIAENVFAIGFNQDGGPCTSGSSIVAYVNQQASVTAISDCILNADGVNNAKLQLQQEIQQAATQKVQSIFMWVAIVVCVLIISLAVITFFLIPKTPSINKSSSNKGNSGVNISDVANIAKML